MKKILSILCLTASLTTMAQTATYKNPIYDVDFADPSIQRAPDGTFYCYATGCLTVKSTDLIKWTPVNNVFSRPTWNDSTYVKNGVTQTDYYSLWASDVNYVNNQYIMYYASALWGNGSRTGIGVATGISPYKFQDRGKLFRSTEIKVENSIDPCYIEEWDKKYLAWGSFNGIYITELSDDGLSVKDMKAVKKIAGTAFEGAMIVKRGKYYYLFASIGSCCEGLNSTYQTVVGRSTNIMGPYVNKSGGLMNNNSYTVIIRSNSAWKGNGHNSEIVTDDAGQDWILYHGYSVSNPNNGRVLLMDRLKWDDNGWPYIEGNTPSITEQPAPIFYSGNGQNVTYKLNNTDFMYSGFKGWTIQENNCIELASGMGLIWKPLMYAKGGKFCIVQQRNGLTDGVYEVRLNNYAKGGKVNVLVGSVPTEVEQHPEASSDAKSVSNDFMAGKYTQSAYGLVVNGTLKIEISGELVDANDEYWAGNLQVINRSQDEIAMALLYDWYLKRVNLTLASAEVDDYYKGKLEGYLNDWEKASGNAAKQTALINIHKTLDRTKTLTAITSVAADGLDEVRYDLAGRRLCADNQHGIVVGNGRKFLKR